MYMFKSKTMGGQVKVIYIYIVSRLLLINWLLGNDDVLTWKDQMRKAGLGRRVWRVIIIEGYIIVGMCVCVCVCVLWLVYK